jgi:hypothetical protein
MFTFQPGKMEAVYASSSLNQRQVTAGCWNKKPRHGNAVFCSVVSGRRYRFASANSASTDRGTPCR